MVTHGKGYALISRISWKLLRKTIGFPYGSPGLRSAATPLNTTLPLEKMESPVDLSQIMENPVLFLINLQIRMFINEDY